MKGILNELRKLLLLLLCAYPSFGICDLLGISSTRAFALSYDLSEYSGNSENLVATTQYYSQGLRIYFSNINDARWAEVIIPNGTSNPTIYPLSKYTKDQNDENMFTNLSNSTVKDAVLLFAEGTSFDNRAEMDEFLPSNQYVTVRFGGGDLDDHEDQLLIADSSQFFNSPPQLNVSTSTLNQLIKYDAAQELKCSVTSTSPWQMGIQDSKYKYLSPLESVSNLTVPQHLLEPGLVYCVYFYSTIKLDESYSFDGLTRSSSDPQVPMVSITAGTFKEYYIKTLGPNLRLRQISGLNLFNQVTKMNVEIESNPGYDGILEFTESLSGTPVWTSVSSPVSFGTTGIENITLEKSGDLRSQWDKSLFFRVRNSRQPIETSGFIPTP